MEMKKKGFSLVEIMVILGALGGVALLVTKIGNNTMNIKNESTVSNDYNDLVRETHFLLSNLKACKVSLGGLSFNAANRNLPLTDLELWTADSSGTKRIQKKFSKGEKFGSLQIQDVSLTLDPESEVTSATGNFSNTIGSQNTTGVLKVSIVKPKVKNTIVDIEHSVNLTYTFSQTDQINTIIDCEDKKEIAENMVWCGSIQNPCGPEIFPAVAIGRYKNGKFTGIFQPTGLVEGKICTGALNYPVALALCESP